MPALARRQVELDRSLTFPRTRFGREHERLEVGRRHHAKLPERDLRDIGPFRIAPDSLAFVRPDEHWLVNGTSIQIRVLFRRFAVSKTRSNMCEGQLAKILTNCEIRLRAR